MPIAKELRAAPAISRGEGRAHAHHDWRLSGACGQLVAVAAGDEQAAMGLYCGNTFATRNQPLRSCGSPTFGAVRINIPAPGTENDDTNPPRIVPHQLFDIAVGLDTLKVGRVPLRVRVAVINLLDTVALYNFLSTFSGTHFVTPRTMQVQLVMPF